MRDDEPSDAVHDLFSETLFGDTPLGRSVLGTVESIEGLTRDDVDGWYRGRYAMPSIVVTAAGRVDHQQVLDLVTAAFGDRLGGDARPAPLRLGDGRAHKPARPAGLIARRTEQTHLLLGTPAMGRLDERRYAAAVLDAAVGGGMSSRLFQEIREKRGLVYSVGSALTHYAGAGSFSVYAGCSKKRVPEVLRLIREELDRVAADGHHRRGGRPQPRPAQGRPGARARGHRLPDEPARQERALLRGVPARAGGARPGWTPSTRSRCARSPPSCSPRRPAWRSSVRTASPTSTGSDRRARCARRSHVHGPLSRGAFAVVVLVSLAVLFAPGRATCPSRPPGVDKLVHARCSPPWR